MKELSVYIHVPFCISRCHYCNFYSNTKLEDNKKQKEAERTYFERCLNEIESYKEVLNNRKITTIYIGGGTPSLVDAKYITSLITAITNNRSNNIEITIEVNPCSVTEEKLIEYKKAGVNRISIGMQTGDNLLLNSIGRSHTREQFINAITNIKKYFNNFNIDLMLGLPNQSLRQVKQAVRFALSFKPKHISCYDLILEKGTKLYREANNELNDDRVLEMRRFVEIMLQQKGIKKYEVSNYAKRGYESKHNQTYWNLGDYLGIGAGAYSKLNDEEFENSNSLNYKQSKKHKLTDKEVFENYVMLGLRTTNGIEIKQYKQSVFVLYGQAELKNKENKLEELKKQGLIKTKKENLFATKTGFNILNKIVLELI